MQLKMVLSDHNSPFQFFDLTREIRDDIYTRIMYFYNGFHYINLAPKGKLREYIGGPTDYQVGLYKRYKKFVSLLTISRQFRDEALPIFWQVNIFDVSNFIDFASTPTLPDDTALDFIGLPGKMHIANIIISVLCTVFVKKPGGNKKDGEYDTDLGITIKGLLEMLPNLQRLDMRFYCSVERRDYPGKEKTEAVLKKAAGSLLEFLDSMDCRRSSEPPKPVINLFGGVIGRPLRTAKSRRPISNSGAYCRWWARYCDPVTCNDHCARVPVLIECNASICGPEVGRKAYLRSEIGLL